METTTEADQNNRELTPTEIKITLAQIEDRLMRFIAAAGEEENFPEYPEDQFPNDEDFAHLEKARISKIREKYNIPKGVYLMGGCAISDLDAPPFMQFAKWWVNGQWDEEIADLFFFHFCEIVEVDFYWVLMDEPGNYCGLDCDDKDESGYVRLEEELKRIGTRSKKKAKINFQLCIGHGWKKPTAV